MWWHFSRGVGKCISLFSSENQNKHKCVWVILLKITCFGFAKVQWLHGTGEVDKPVRFSHQIFSGFNIQKIILKKVYFDRVTHTHTYPFNSSLSGTTWVSWYQKGKTNLDFTEARDSEWQWYQLGHMQVCTSLQTDNNASTPPLSFLQAGCPSCRPTNSVKALKARVLTELLKK